MIFHNYICSRVQKASKTVVDWFLPWTNLTFGLIYFKIYNITIIESRGWEIFTSDEEDYPENGTFRDYFIVQADKSTCQSNNRTVGIFGYPGVPTIDAQLLLDEIAADYGVFIDHTTHTPFRF